MEVGGKGAFDHNRRFLQEEIHHNSRFQGLDKLVKDAPIKMERGFAVEAGVNAYFAEALEEAVGAENLIVGQEAVFVFWAVFSLR
ncbi:MAG: hypothetical protein IPI11_13705 [Haliscomenobacter sp.]|nr:hypothetical protein [Haliscomenobacter sp.]